MSRPFVKVFGERNTGTRALLQMLRASGDVTLRMAGAGSVAEQKRCTELADRISKQFTGAWRKLYMDALRDNQRHLTDPLLTWKHAAPLWHDSFAEQRARVIFMVRNPYSWVLSMARRPYHIAGRRPENLEEFLTRPWMTQRRDNTDILLPDVLALWQAKLQAYRQFAKQAKANGVRTGIMNFESFVADPVASAGVALSDCGIASVNLRPARRNTKDKDRTLAEIQAYYAQEGWRADLTCRSVELINRRMDWELAGRFGYRRLPPEDFAERPDAEAQAAVTGDVEKPAPPPEMPDLERERRSAATA
jgi:hypothetical protein